MIYLAVVIMAVLFGSESRGEYLSANILYFVCLGCFLTNGMRLTNMCKFSCSRVVDCNRLCVRVYCVSNSRLWRWPCKCNAQSPQTFVKNCGITDSNHDGGVCAFSKMSAAAVATSTPAADRPYEPGPIQHLTILPANIHCSANAFIYMITINPMGSLCSLCASTSMTFHISTLLG